MVSVGYQWLVWVPVPADRFTNFAKNFLNPVWASNTFYSLLASFGAIWLVAGLARADRLAGQFDERAIAICRWGAIYSVPTTIALVLTMGLARETRLFFPPFVFLIPLSLWFLRYYGEKLIRFNLAGAGIPSVFVVSLAMIEGIHLSRLLFPSFDFRAWTEFSQVYLGIHFGLAMALIFQLSAVSLGDLLRIRLARDD